MGERKEAFFRILVAIVSGIIIGLWKALVQFLTIFHWFYVVFTGKRSRSIAEFCNLWTTQMYKFVRYMTFATNSRPFPFSGLGKVMEPVELSQQKKK